MARQTPKSTKSPRKSTSQPKATPTLYIVLGLVAALIVVAIAVILIRQNAASTSSMPAEVDVAQAQALVQDGAFLLDVRTQEEWNQSHVPGATLIPLDQLAQRVQEAPKDRQVVVMCRSGNRSQQGRDILRQAGFTDVTSMAGGINAWTAAGFPTVSGP